MLPFQSCGPLYRLPQRDPALTWGAKLRRPPLPASDGLHRNLGNTPFRDFKSHVVVLRTGTNDGLQIHRSTLGGPRRSLCSCLLRPQHKGARLPRTARGVGIQSLVEPLIANRDAAQYLQSFVVQALSNLRLAEAELGQQAVARKVCEGRPNVLPREDSLHVKNFAAFDI